MEKEFNRSYFFQAIILLIGFLWFVVSFVVFKNSIVLGAVALGLAMIFIGYGSQIIALLVRPKPDTTLNIQTLNSARILIIGGIIIIVLAMLIDFFKALPR